MNQLSIIFIITSILFNVHCKKESAKHSDFPKSETNPRLVESKKTIEFRRTLNTELSGFKTLNEAVINMLDEVCIQKKNHSNLKSILSQKEKDLILYPNIYGSGTSLDVTPLEDYDKLIYSFENLAIQKLSNLKIKKSDFKSLKIWTKSVKPYGKANFHKIGLITLKTDGGEIEITEIKSVIELNGCFKAAIISP